MNDRATHFMLLVLCVLILPTPLFSKSSEDRDRARDFYQGEEKQLQEKKNQEQKAMIKEIQKQQLEMQKAQTQDPGRKQQLQQEIDRLQREITQHRQQAQALKEHADKAKKAAKDAESGNQKKGKQEKSANKSSAGSASEFAQISTGLTEAAGLSEDPDDEKASTLDEAVASEELVDLNAAEKELGFEEAAAASKEQMAEIAAMGGVQVDEGSIAPTAQLFMDAGLESEDRPGDREEREARRARRATERSSNSSGRINRVLPTVPPASTPHSLASQGKVDAGVGLSGKLKPALPKPTLSARTLKATDPVDAFRSLAFDAGPMEGTLLASSEPAPGRTIARSSQTRDIRTPDVQAGANPKHGFIMGSTRKVRHRIQNP